MSSSQAIRKYYPLLKKSAQNRDTTEDNAIASSVTDVLSREVFQFSYIEPESAVIERFKLWLENVLIVGLEKWSQQV